jgi:hypothetical protein
MGVDISEFPQKIRESTEARHLKSDTETSALHMEKLLDIGGD